MMQSEMVALTEEVAAEQHRIGETVQPPATDEQITGERDALRDRFGATLPDDYARFLRRVNGVDFDGVVLHGAGCTEAEPGPEDFWQGLADTNGLWRERPGRDGYLVLGETGMDLLTVDLDGGRPVLRDRVSNDVAERFASVNEAIERILGSRF